MSCQHLQGLAGLPPIVFLLHVAVSPKVHSRQSCQQVSSGVTMQMRSSGKAQCGRLQMTSSTHSCVYHSRRPPRWAWWKPSIGALRQQHCEWRGRRTRARHRVSRRGPYFRQCHRAASCRVVPLAEAHGSSGARQHGRRTPRSVSSARARGSSTPRSATERRATARCRLNG